MSGEHKNYKCWSDTSAGAFFLKHFGPAGGSNLAVSSRQCSTPSMHMTRRAVVSRAIRVQRRYAVRIRPMESRGLVSFGNIFELFIERYRICTYFPTWNESWGFVWLKYHKCSYNMSRVRCTQRVWLMSQKSWKKSEQSWFSMKIIFCLWKLSSDVDILQISSQHLWNSLTFYNMYRFCTAQQLHQKPLQSATNLPTGWVGFGRHISSAPVLL